MQGNQVDQAYLAAEAKARLEIDRQLGACGWLVQDRTELNLYRARGVAAREWFGRRADSARDRDGELPARPLLPDQPERFGKLVERERSRDGHHERAGRGHPDHLREGLGI